jgi:predicted enzyme related to lactoylglutathione lyase
MSKKKAAPSASVIAPSELELFTKDLSGSSGFLRDAFTWEVNELPEWKMAFAKFGVPLTAMVRTKDDVLAPASVTQTSTFYVTVPDFDKEQARLVKLGAKVFKAKTSVENMGSWGYLRVPGNFIVGLWQNDPKHVPQPKPDNKKPGEDGTVSFLELVSSAPEEATAFFLKAFSWDFNYTPFGEEKYWYFQGDRKTFSVGLRLPQKPEKGSNLIPYVNVSSLDDATSNALKHGAKKLFPKPRPYGEFGTGGVVTIPGGVSVGFWEDTHGHAHHDGEDGEKEVKEEKAPAKKGKAAPKKSAASPKAPAAKRARAESAGRKNPARPAKKARKD